MYLKTKRHNVTIVFLKMAHRTREDVESERRESGNKHDWSLIVFVKNLEARKSSLILRVNNCLTTEENRRSKTV